MTWFGNLLSSWWIGIQCLPMFASFANFMTVLAIVILVLAPILRYLFSGWGDKRNELLSFFDDDATVAYFEQFQPNKQVTKANARQVLQQHYDRRFGWRHYLVPVFFLVISTVLGADWAAQYIPDPTVPQCSLAQLPVVAVMALAGGYMWIVGDIIARVRGRNLGPADIYLSLLRLVIAVPLGYAFSKLAAEAIAPFIAFALGAFPLDPLLAVLRRLTYKKLDLGDTGEEAADELIKLQGVSSAISERYRAEDVFTISQLAVADPVSMTMRTNLNFSFVLDCVSQASAWMYLGEKLNALRPAGMRGAFEIKTFVDEMDDSGTGAEATRNRELTKKVLPQLAEAAGMNVNVLESALRQIAEDPYTVLMHKIWH